MNVCLVDCLFARFRERRKQKIREENWRKLEEAAANNASKNPELQARNIALINPNVFDHGQNNSELSSCCKQIYVID
jgi:hypothetical protein